MFFFIDVNTYTHTHTLRMTNNNNDNNNFKSDLFINAVDSVCVFPDGPKNLIQTLIIMMII